MFERIISLENLLFAWNEFKRGKGKKLDVQEFAFNLEDSLFKLHADLVNFTYKHGSYQTFFVCDPKLREINKASVYDRVVHQAIFRVLYYHFDQYFINDSYSCRFKKGTQSGVRRLETFGRKVSKNWHQETWFLKCDVRKFFDGIDHDILRSLIVKRISSPGVLWLFEQILNSFRKELNCGLPLGNVTSQLLANIYLNELDQFVKHNLKQKYYLRYCDDFIILNQNKGYLEDLIPLIKEFLEEKLKLSLHTNKIIIRKLRQGADFLGYVVRPHHTVFRTRTKRRMLRRVNEKNLNSYLGFLKHCRGHKIEERIKKM